MTLSATAHGLVAHPRVATSGRPSAPPPFAARALRLAALAVALAACGPPRVPEPLYGPQRLPDSAYVEIDDPPPPVQPSDVGSPPSRSHVWVDGQWNYQRTTSKWTWEEGAWCVPPANSAYYAKPLLRRVRRPLGRITRWNDLNKRFEEVDAGDDRWLWARGRWYVRDVNGVVVPNDEGGTCVTTPPPS